MKDLIDPGPEIGRPQMVLPPIQVIQTGARHGYAIPRLLEAAGCLDRLETTTAFAAPHDATIPPWMPTRWENAWRRRRPGIDAGLMRRSFVADLARHAARKGGAGHMATRALQNRILGWGARRRGPGKARIALSVDGGGGPNYLRWLKSRGLTIVVDIAVTPRAAAATWAAQSAAPDWPGPRLSDAEVARFKGHYRALVALADWVFCPSPAVRDDLCDMPGARPDRIRVLPYPLAFKPASHNAPERGRILFVGSDPVRKGLPETILAVQHLTRTAPELNATLTIAGRLPSAVAGLGVLRDAHFLGHIGADEMRRQLARADLLVLPSHAEGFPAAAIEAMAAGLPVVATRESGVPIDHGRNGFLLASHDPIELANRIAQIVQDRTLRNRLSEGARATSHTYAQAPVARLWLKALAEVAEGAT